MAYDPCLPAPVDIVHRTARVIHHHSPIFHVLGRRVPPAHSVRRIVDGCPKISRNLWLPRRFTRVVSHLADPPLLTVLGISVVGISAFPGVTIIQAIGTPEPGHSVVTPPGGPGGPPTNVPEPGTAAILAVAMAVVLVSSWIHGSRAFKVKPESEISGPLKPRVPRSGMRKPQRRADDIEQIEQPGHVMVVHREARC